MPLIPFGEIGLSAACLQTITRHWLLQTEFTSVWLPIDKDILGPGQWLQEIGPVCSTRRLAAHWEKAEIVSCQTAR
jgi:hypothetical protein